MYGELMEDVLQVLYFGFEFFKLEDFFNIIVFDYEFVFFLF